MRRLGLALLLLAAPGCYPTTTHPDLEPVPGASRIEVELFVPAATRALAVALDADSIPVSRTEPEDGWLETPWFDVTTMRPTTRRPIGPEIVKVRAFVTPGRPNWSVIDVETVYRPVADPSALGRDLDRQVPVGHPAAVRVKAVLDSLLREYGEEPGS